MQTELEVVIFYLQDDVPKCHIIYNDLVGALKMAEQLRSLGASHVCISSKSSNNVTKPGVADVQPGYDWKKRRI